VLHLVDRHCAAARRDTASSTVATLSIEQLAASSLCLLGAHNHQIQTVAQSPFDPS